MERIEQQGQEPEKRPAKKNLLITEVIDNVGGAGGSLHEISQQQFEGNIDVKKPIGQQHGA